MASDRKQKPDRKEEKAPKKRGGKKNKQGATPVVKSARRRSRA